MFDFFRKKTQVEKLIEADGIDHVTDRFSEIIARKLPTREIAYQFILQELDGASLGNEASKNYAAHSGIHQSQYKDALSSSVPQVDGPDGPQQLLASLSLELLRDRELMAAFRCKIGDKIMKKFEIGRYEREDARIEILLISLKNSLMEDQSVMGRLTPNIPPLDSAKVRHIHYRETNVAAAEQLVSELTMLTDMGVDEIIRMALASDEIKELSIKSKIEEKFSEIIASMLAAVNKDDVKMLDVKGATVIAREMLIKISEQDLINCKTNVATIFVLSHIAKSAFDDGNLAIAKYVEIQCKPIAGQIMKLSHENYNHVEFTMFDNAMEIFKEIDIFRM